MFYFSLKYYSEDIKEEALLFGTPMYMISMVMISMGDVVGKCFKIEALNFLSVMHS